MSVRPSIKQLEYAVALAEHRHFRKAADASFITQPAMSAQIRQLEDLLGVDLFERDRRKVLLTRAGEEVTRRAKRLLADLDDLMEAAQSLGKPLSGPLRLGIIPTVAPYLLPLVLPGLRKRYPDLVLYLREEQTLRCLQLLESGGLDVVVLALPAEGAEVESLPLFEDRFWLAVPKDHPLAKRKRLREEDLAGEHVLLLEDGHCLRDQALEVCHLTGAKEKTDFRATSLHTLVQMVSNGLGVTLVPEMALATEASRAREIETHAFTQPSPGRTIGLAWRRSSPREEDFRLLGELIRQVTPARTGTRARSKGKRSTAGSRQAPRNAETRSSKRKRRLT